MTHHLPAGKNKELIINGHFMIIEKRFQCHNVLLKSSALLSMHPCSFSQNPFDLSFTWDLSKWLSPYPVGHAL